MIIKERELKGVFEIQLEPKEDHRGFFMRVYDDNIFKNHGLHRNWVQENHSLNKKKNGLFTVKTKFQGLRIKEPDLMLVLNLKQEKEV